MAIKVNFRGIEFTVNTAGEAAALARELIDEPQPKLGRPAVKDNDLFPETAAAKENAIAVNFLNAIINNGAGADSKQIAAAIGVSHPKGIGGRAAKINSMLSNLGFNPDDVYSNTKTLDGRIWKPRQRIGEALEKLSVL